MNIEGLLEGQISRTREEFAAAIARSQGERFTLLPTQAKRFFGDGPTQSEFLRRADLLLDEVRINGTPVREILEKWEEGKVVELAEDQSFPAPCRHGKDLDRSDDGWLQACIDEQKNMLDAGFRRIVR